MVRYCLVNFYFLVNFVHNVCLLIFTTLKCIFFSVSLNQINSTETPLAYYTLFYNIRFREIYIELFLIIFNDFIFILTLFRFRFYFLLFFNIIIIIFFNFRKFNDFFRFFLFVYFLINYYY